MAKSADALYSSEFYAGQVDGSANSAAAVVPLILSLFPVRSVVDVGCGVGPWAAEFISRGVSDVWGIDGDYVKPSQLRIPLERFAVHDLTKPISLGRTFDLAVCLEVGEHLPASRAQSLVSDLTSLASCVLFSAAVPGQGGTHHINEQYLPYWIDLFASQGYEGVDPIRPRILGDDSVEWWYQQNIVMFAAPNHPLLAKGFLRPQSIIHQRLYELAKNPGPPPLGKLARSLPSSVRESIRHRLRLH
jgi:SAM-dependent methyltransferase